MRPTTMTLTLCGVLLALPGPARGQADLDCQRTIVKEGSKYTQAHAKALTACEVSKVKGSLPPATDCRVEAKTAAKIAKAASRLRSRIDDKCGGANGFCDGGAGEDPPSALGWDAACPSLDPSCAAPIAHCGDIADCLVCLDDTGIDRALALVFEDLAATDPGDDVNDCQQRLGKEVGAFLGKKSNELRKCWERRLKGSLSGTCPQGSSSFAIGRAESKMRVKVCGRCGGDDRECGGGDDLPPAAIGFAGTCPDVAIPGGAACGGSIDDLQDLVDCVACVTEFEVDCMDRAQVQQVQAYPPECQPPTPTPTATPTPVPTSCPSRLQLDGEELGLDLDVGWGGIAHDITGPFLKRLTLAVSGCAGSAPTCGVCDLSGPVPNAGPGTFPSQRCRDKSWIACTSDADCTGAGAAGPCVFFLGPPVPAVQLCVTTDIVGPITGTVDVQTGEMSVALSLTNTFTPGSEPCPRCVAGLCTAGPRGGEPCAVHGHSPLFDHDLSLDCPSSPGLVAPSSLVLATGLQTATLTAAGPPCTAFGFGGQACLCSTCNDASGAPCMTDADCPDNPPGTPGICGGLRCLAGASNPGAPCSASSDCPGGSCGLPGEPTRPNGCVDGTCVPNTPPDDDSINEGVCATGPVVGRCSLDQGMACGVDTDCPVGQGCTFEFVECFTGNGVQGTGISAGGVADPPTAGVAHPVLGSVFCTGSASAALAGLPGPARLTAPATARLDPPPCPSRLHLRDQGDGGGLDLDLGFTGVAHDATGPLIEGLTLAVSNCAGDGEPTCGACDVSGPIPSSGPEAFPSQRCQDKSWIACTTDAQCAAEGAGACVFFLGPPMPVVGLLCLMSSVVDPVDGFIDVESGDLALTLPLAHKFVPIVGSFAEPCPRCSAGTCGSGPRSGQPCTVHGQNALFGYDVSLDCPPTASSAGTARSELLLTTSPQTATLTAASPNCVGAGFSNLKCACSTCNNLAATPCMVHGDCPDNPPGTPGICGGPRCLAGSSNAGAPCVVSGDCQGGTCGTPGEPTIPNKCTDAICTPNTPPDGGSINEGVCASGPFSGHCSGEPFRVCADNAHCAPGDICVDLEGRACFTGNGQLGASVSVDGLAAAPVDGIAEPLIGGLSCLGPTGAGGINAIYGLPGLERTTLPVTIELE